MASPADRSWRGYSGRGEGRRGGGERKRALIAEPSFSDRAGRETGVGKEGFDLSRTSNVSGCASKSSAKTAKKGEKKGQDEKKSLLKVFYFWL